MNEKKVSLKNIIKTSAKTTADISANSSLAWFFHQKKCPVHLLKKD